MAEAVAAPSDAAAPEATIIPDLSEADAEIEEMQKKVAEMEEEAEKLKLLTDAVEDQDEGGDRVEADLRSVYVGQVDYGSTPEELQEHFKSCGTINRITIMVDKYTGSPKGFAYIEFADEQCVQNSLLLNGSLFRGRQLKVVQKRTNIPGFSKGKGKFKGKYKYDPYDDPYAWDYGYYMYPPPKG